MCGKQGDTISAIVEGVILKVCDVCSKHGEVVRVRPKEDFKREKKVEESDVVELIVNDYSDKIKKAREKLNLKQEELAKSIAEKESVIQKMETGSFKPSINLARKLERFLKIKLVEQVEDEPKVAFKSGKTEGFTLGDFIKKKN